MNAWNQLPVRTKIYLAIMAYLIFILVFLIAVRAAGLPVGERLARVLFSRAATEANATTTAEVKTALDQAVASLPPGSPWLRAATTATIRSGPGQDFAAMAVLESGQVVQVVGASQDRQWWAIPVPYIEGGRGWVAAGDVVVENASSVPVETARPTEIAIPTDLLPVAQAITNVNVRNGPDIQAAKIGALENGQIVQVVGTSEDGLWWAIRMAEGKAEMGWIARDYVLARNVEDLPVVTVMPSGVSAGVATPRPGGPYLTAVWEVNIRAGPGTEYAVIGSLKQGTAAEIVGVSEDRMWWAVGFKDAESGRGWVSMEFVQAVNAENVPVLK
jgi:uncharacterized protein YraI